MANESSSGGWEFVAGLFVGGLVGGLLGAAAAMLLAPQSGEDTRAYLKEKGLELKDRAGDLSFDVRERANVVSERARVVMEERMAQMQDAIQTGKETAERTKEELLAKLEAAKKGDSASSVPAAS
jgi:gas vesicle protein